MMGEDFLIRGYLKAKAAISIGIAALLCLGLIGCVAQESPTATPSDVPAFSEGEAIAIVQTLLIQGGCHSAIIGESSWFGEYVGEGVWSVTASGFLQGKWNVFENSLSVSIEEGEMLPC